MELRDAPQMADYLGVPTFYTTDVIKEDAGNGNVRIWNCCMRGGILVPQCEIIVPASRLQQIGRDASAFAMDLFRRTQMSQLADMVGARH